jgi:hypothetical protein
VAPAERAEQVGARGTKQNKRPKRRRRRLQRHARRVQLIGSKCSLRCWLRAQHTHPHALLKKQTQKHAPKKLKVLIRNRIKKTTRAQLLFRSTHIIVSKTAEAADVKEEAGHARFRKPKVQPPSSKTKRH